VWDMVTAYMEIVCVGYGYSMHGSLVWDMATEYMEIVSVGYGYSMHGDL